MNPTAKKKPIRIILITAAVLAALVAAVLLIARGMRSQTVNVYRVSDVAEGYWGDNTELSGQVSEGSVENLALNEGMVEKIAVQVGDKVKKGDLLVKYDTSSYQLTLSGDQAQIAMLQSQINQAQQDIAAYRRMTPAEDITPPPAPTPKPTPATVASVETNTPAAEQIDGVKYYNCTTGTVVQGEVLKALSQSGETAGFRLYDGRELLGLWFVRGEDLAVFGEDWAPDPWLLGDGLALNGDGTVSINTDVPHYGTFESRLPVGDGDDPDPYDPASDAYTRAEIAQMIRDKQSDIQMYQRDLQKAQLKYKRDQLTSPNGEVKAADDGVVTFVADPHAIQTGETLLTIKGSANASVTVYVDELSLGTLNVGDELMVNAYESGASFPAKVASVGTEPAADYSWDPNNSMYPVVCVSEDETVDLNIGEYCSVTPMQQSEVSDALYIPLYFVREDAEGSYVLAAGENGKLERRALRTGKTVWGSSIEIRSGLTADDLIAFPYGRSARPGSPTRESDLDALWGY